jgi:hypothetical protein
MKNKATLHGEIECNNLGESGNGAVGQRRRCFKLGLDVELRNVAVAIQCERGPVGLAQKLSLQQLIGWVKQKVAQGHAVYTVYECCGFGYTLHEQLVEAGATSFITTPMRLSLERRRKNDRMDARELCVRLSRYVDGQRDELRAIRIPSRTEQQRRELGRQREFWKRQVRRLENHGRALRIEHEHESLEAGWAGPRKWKRIGPQCSEFVRGQLQPVMEQIRAAKANLDRLTREIEALVKEQSIPVGLGALTVSLIEGEVVRLAALQQTQSGGQLHWLLSQRTQLRRGATLRRDRSSRQQTSSGAIGGGGLATPSLAATVARPPEIFSQAQTRRVVEKENSGGSGPPTGHRPMALENLRATAAELGWRVASVPLSDVK